MSKARIKRVNVKDNNLSEMFSEMLGEGDPIIIAEKDLRLKSLVKIIALVSREFATGAFSQFPEYQVWRDEFLSFSTKTHELLALPYLEVKDHNQTKQLIMVCRSLIAYDHFLTESPLSDRWIITHPGLVYQPFQFSQLDVKHVWNNQQSSSKVKQYLLQTFSIMYQKCHEVYKVVTSPDIDVKKFSQVIVDSIDKVKGVPELDRCREAFTKIKESVSLLEDNFSNYYKDMVQSENPNMLIENFIIDVSQGQTMNLTLMRQFRVIIGFYKKQSAGKIKDPKVQKLFESLNSRMDTLEKKSKQ